MLISSYLLNYWISKANENEKFHYKFVELSNKCLGIIQPLVGKLIFGIFLLNMIILNFVLTIRNSIKRFIQSFRRGIS